LLCISVMSFFAARLSGRGRFAAFALGPSLLNLCIIVGLLVEDQLSRSGHAAAWAVFAGGVLQVGFILLASKAAGIEVIWPALGLGKATRRFFRNLLPAMLSSGALQVAVMLDTILASMLTERTLAHLYFADRLYQLPIGLISVALGTVLLPELAKRQTAATGEGPHPIVQALLICAVVGVPLSIAIWAFGEDIIRLLFERGTFTAADTQSTAALLNGYALGLIPALMVRPLVVVFQAREDTTTPFRLLLISLVVNAGCKVLLIEDLGPVALSLGTSAGMLLYATLLFIMAPRRSMNR
jgi:putative peptidoglycan lipid II flippase